MPAWTSSAGDSTEAVLMVKRVPGHPSGPTSAQTVLSWWYLSVLDGPHLVCFTRSRGVLVFFVFFLLTRLTLTLKIRARISCLPFAHRHHDDTVCHVFIPFSIFIDFPLWPLFLASLCGDSPVVKSECWPLSPFNKTKKNQSNWVH